MSFSNKLFSILTQYNSKELIANLDIKFDFITYKNELIITTIGDKTKPNCYVVSPYNMIIIYSKDELYKIESKFLKKFFLSLINLFASILEKANIDKIQTLNNYILSTNFFSKMWEEIEIKEVEKLALKKYPTHTLLIRSINKTQNPKLFTKLKQNSWIPVVSRQVYIFEDEKNSLKHQNYRVDKKLLNDINFIFCTPNPDNIDDFKEVERLYNLLYLEKYSIHNIHFKAKYIQQLVQKKLVHLRLLKDLKNSKYVGVVGLIGEGGIITTPILGYDITYHKKYALYRRVIAYATNYALKKGYLLNLSSGASHFKTLRGAKSEIEYMFVKTTHLSLFQKTVWRVISIISNLLYAPLLKRLKL